MSKRPGGEELNLDLIKKNEEATEEDKKILIEELRRAIRKLNKTEEENFDIRIDYLDQDFAEVLAEYAKEAKNWGLLQLRVERKIETEGLKILARKFNGDGLYICGERDFSMEEVQELVEYVRRTGGNLFLRFDHAISPEMLEMLLSLPTEIEKCLFIDLPKGMERAGKLMREHDFARAYVDGGDVDDLVFDERKSIKKTIDALPEEARAQIEDWLTFFDSNPNFKHLVAESGVELMDFMKKNKIANPEAFHNLNAGKDVKVLLKDFKALLVLLPKNFSQETFEEIFERKNDIGYQDNDVFLTVYADELVQTIADYLSSIKNSLDEKARKRGALSKRIIFLREKIAEIDNLKAKKKMQKQLLAAEESEQRDFSKIDKQQQGCSELLDRLANFNYLALGKSGFRLAGRTREELTLGDKCSDCTSANISGMNFWTVPVWLADPGFNFLLQYDENGRLAHKFGVVLDINRKGEIVLIVDSLELADAQKEQAGMYGGLADERKEQDMMDEAIDFIKQWAKRMGLDSQNIYSTSFSNTGVKELEWYPLKQISVAKLGGLEYAKKTALLGDRNFSGKVDSVYLQHCGRIDNEIGDEVNESERIREREKVFSDIEKVLRLYLEQQKGNNGLEEDYKKIREIIGLAVENPGEAARKMRLFLHLNASEQTKRLLSINEGKTEYKLDTYLHKHNLGLEKFFETQFGATKISNLDTNKFQTSKELCWLGEQKKN